MQTRIVLSSAPLGALKNAITLQEINVLLRVTLFLTLLPNFITVDCFLYVC